MKANDVVEEGLSDRHCSVRVAGHDEVSVFRKSVDDDGDHRFATNLWKTFDKIQRYVFPDRTWYIEWIE